MAWPAPVGSWGHPINPDSMAMDSLTAEQWTAVQQTWQQWTQWQQQYAQWQNQYGDKYAQQMHAMQAMGGMFPTPPTTSAPPVPPPPDKPPPPPPPHENDQPLYGQQNKPDPKIASNINSYKNVESIAKNNSNQNWPSKLNNSSTAPQYNNTVSTPITANSEALKKLAEEERLFDIQFKKWEDEIFKWRSENVNHPDKQAYKEYEQKFETCRAQLMERRQQMNQKKARLMGNASPTTIPVGNLPTNNMPSNVHNVNLNNTQVKHNQNYNYNNQHIHPNLANPPPIITGRGNNNVGARDQYDSYENYGQHNNSHVQSNLFPTSVSNKGIPGLDLVPETIKPLQSAAEKTQSVIDITDEQSQQSQAIPHDYTAISKGINNILGDEKILNILSMVRSQTENQSDTQTSFNQDKTNISQNPYRHVGLLPDPQVQMNDSFGSHNSNNKSFEDQHLHQADGYHRGAQDNMRYPSHQNVQRYDGMHQDKYNMNNAQYNRNPQYSGNNKGQAGHQTMLRQNMPRNMNEPPMRFNNDMVHQNTHLPLIQNANRNMPPPLMNVDQQNNNRNVHPTMNIQQPTNRNVLPPIDVGQQNANNWHDARPLPDVKAYGMQSNQPSRPQEPKWADIPLFVPSIIVDYEHKSLRLKARDFIDPVHTFDYNHKSKQDENRSMAFGYENELESPLFKRKGDIIGDNSYADDRNSRYRESRDYDKLRLDRENSREAWAPRGMARDDVREPRRRYEERRRTPDRYDDRRKIDDRYDDRRKNDDRNDDRRRLDDRLHDDRRRPDYRYDDRHRDDLDKFTRRDDSQRDRHYVRREEYRPRSDSKDSRKRSSKETEISDKSEKSKEDCPPASNVTAQNTFNHLVMIDDILEPPGRSMRPEKIIIILRGPPGSGKSYLAKLIRDREAEHGGSARILSIDDYFMQEGDIEEKDPISGKMVKKQKYEYDEKSEDMYMSCLKRTTKRHITDGFFSFLIFDACNNLLRHYADIWNFGRQNGFQVYVCTMELDPNVCHKRNIHNRDFEDIQKISMYFFNTPAHHISLDATTLLQSAAIQNVDMEDVNSDDDVVMEDVEPEVSSSFTSKWEKMDDANQLARLDGTSKPLRASKLSMDDYLQLEDWQPAKAQPGKKTVRWADIEEGRQQEKMRAIGFVVGQTDWNRMTDPTMGSSALTQTKYIERVRRF